MNSLSGFNQINPFNLNDNVFDLLDNQWMLITAGTSEKYNTMTASWGGFGYLWNKSIAIIFIRPQRYTFQFVEENATFTLCFFDKKYKKALNICGSKSGRDINKVKEAGLNSIVTPNGSIAFKEARMIMDCRKLYADTIKPDNFIEKGIIDKIYPSSDFHKFYIGEIISCFVK